jgi:hypothetical protein
MGELVGEGEEKKTVDRRCPLLGETVCGEARGLGRGALAWAPEVAAAARLTRARAWRGGVRWKEHLTGGPRLAVREGGGGGAVAEPQMGHVWPAGWAMVWLFCFAFFYFFSFYPHFPKI